VWCAIVVPLILTRWLPESSGTRDAATPPGCTTTELTVDPLPGERKGLPLKGGGDLFGEIYLVIADPESLGLQG
jgi:hypothetical protein